MRTMMAVSGRRQLIMLALSVAAAVPPRGVASAQPSRITSTDTTPCTGCTLTLDSIATLGRGVNPGEFFARQPISAAVVNGRLAVVSTMPLQLFDLTGKLVDTLGRRGQGPGEFPGWLDDIDVGPSRDVYLFSRQTVNVYDSTFRLLRKVSLARGSLNVAVLSDGKFAGLNTPPAVPGMRTAAQYSQAYPAPLLQFFSATGATLQSAGTTISVADQLITAGSSGTVWTAKKAPYELKLWNQNGTLTRTIERVTPFFDRKAWAGPFPSTGPPTNLRVMRQDAQGRLWTVVRVAKRNWRELERAGQSCCESIVEVLDPSTGELLASTRIGAAIHLIMDGGFLGATADGPNGEPWLILYRARLVVPGR